MEYWFKLKKFIVEKPFLFLGLPGVLFIVVGLCFWVYTVSLFIRYLYISTNSFLLGSILIIIGLILIMAEVILWSLNYTRTRYNQSLSNRVLNLIDNEKNFSKGSLILRLRDEGNTPEETDIVLDQLEEDKKIDIINTSANTLIQFIKSSRERWFLNIYSITTINIISWFLVPEERIEFAWIRYITGTLFIFLAPGASMSVLLDLDKSLGSLENFIIICILSIALVPSVGLVLNFTPWGIEPKALLVSLSMFCYLLSGASFFSRWRTYTLFNNAIVRITEK